MKYKATLFIWFLITTVYFITASKGLSLRDLASYGGLYTWNGELSSLSTLVTYGFLHTSFRHFGLNLLLGVPLMLYSENKVSSMFAFTTFIFGVIIGGIGFWVLHDQERILTVGASAGNWALLSAGLFSIFTKEKINLIEFAVIFNITMLVFYDASIATNINNVSHVFGYFSAFVVLALHIILKRRDENENHTSRPEVIFN